MPIAHREATGAVAMEALEPRSAWGAADVWDEEYACVRAIPSSLRFAPSRAFARLDRLLGDLKGLKVLDVGAGTGRHSLHAATSGATVHAIDHSSVACEIHRARVGEAGLAESITVEQGRLGISDLPDDRYDVIIDSYASCHILSAENRLRFLDALMGLLRPRGRLYTASMGDRDSYYHDHLVAGSDAIALDPCNGVAKLLQSVDVAARDGVELGYPVGSTTERFIDAVNGTDEWREVHASVLSR